MRIQIISDIHLEYKNNFIKFFYYPLQPAGDILLIAGDLMPFGMYRNEKGKKFLDYCSKNWKQTYIVAGNHEYYGNSLYLSYFKTKDYLTKTYDNVALLNRDTIKLNDVDKDIYIHACTLWSSIPLRKYDVVENNINDFKFIFKFNEDYFCDVRIKPEDVNELYTIDRNFLSRSLTKHKLNDKDVHIVFTHHAPSKESVKEIHLDNDCNSVFFSNQTRFIKKHKPNYWIHGHTHHNKTFMIDDCKVMQNMYHKGKHNEPVVIEV